MWPKRLNHKLALFVGLLISSVAGVLLINQFSTQHNKEVSLISTRLINSSQSLAQILKKLNLQKNFASIEPYLFFLANEPETSNVSILSQSGQRIISAVIPRQGNPYVSYEEKKLNPPAAATLTKKVEYDNIYIWQPFKDSSGTQYWFFISASLKPINNRIMENLISAILVSFVCVLIAISLFLFAIRNPFKQLQQFITFAETLTSKPNQQLSGTPFSEELDALRVALNRLAKSWHQQINFDEQILQNLKNQQMALDSHSMVCITDTQGRIQYANHQLCNFSLFSQGELIGKPIQLLNSGFHNKEFFKTMWRELIIGRIWHGEICNKKKNGEYYWVKTTIVPLKDEQQRPVQFLTIQTDVTRYVVGENESNEVAM